jgi:hypothetical protein
MVSTKLSGRKLEAAPNQNIENDPMQRNKRAAGMDALPAKTF